MAIKYIPVSLRTLNEDKRGKQRQYYILKRADNFDFSSIGDTIYNQIKSDSKRGSNRDSVITKTSDIIRTFPLAKRFHTYVELLPTVLTAKVNDIIYDAYNDRFLYMLQRYDGGSVERGEKKNIYLVSDSINFPNEARNVKKKYDINYIPKEKKDESMSLDEALLTGDLYCDEPITVISYEYDNDLEQYVITIEIDKTSERKDLYLDETDFDKLKIDGHISDSEGHELIINSDILNESYNKLQNERHRKYKNRHTDEDDWTRKRIALNKLKKEKYKIDTEEGIYKDELEKLYKDNYDENESLNESFGDPYLKELIGNSFKSGYGDGSFKDSMQKTKFYLNLQFDKITKDDYEEVQPKQARKYKNNIKLYINYIDGEPFITGIVNDGSNVVYDYRAVRGKKRSELAIVNDSTDAIVFNDNISSLPTNIIRHNRRMARADALAITDPNEIKKENIRRYKNIIAEKKYANDVIDDLVKNTIVYTNRKIENESTNINDDSKLNRNKVTTIKNLMSLLNKLFNEYTSYVELKNDAKNNIGYDDITERILNKRNIIKDIKKQIYSYE